MAAKLASLADSALLSDLILFPTLILILLEVEQTPGSSAAEKIS
jgi:hypothetical protein